MAAAEDGEVQVVRVDPAGRVGLVVQVGREAVGPRGNVLPASFGRVRGGISPLEVLKYPF